MPAATPIAYVENLSEIIGGGPLSLLTLLHNLDPAQYTPVVIFYTPGGLPTQLTEAGIEVHVIPRGRGWALPLSVCQLSGLFRRRGIHLVHVNSLDLRAGLAAQLARVPCVGHLRVIFPFTWIDRLFVRLSTCVISVSNAVRDSFCERHPELKARFTTIPNSVSLTNLEPPADIRKELGLSPTTPLVASVSRIDPWKGLPTFVEAAAQIRARLPETRFLLLGDSDPADPDTVSHEQDLRHRVSELGLDDV
ncbi:MAG: glycosyltransferase, partial [bacterium]|nr:glycosyltransferase [bacterium]